MKLKSVFVDQSNIIRSGWRFAIFLAVFLFLVIAFGGLSGPLFNAADIPTAQQSNLYLFVTGVFTLTAALLASWLCGRLLENLPFKTLGASFTTSWLTHFVFGVFIGTITLGFAVLIASTLGGLRFSFNNDQGSRAMLLSMGASLAVFAVGAAWEEALFRGYIFQTFLRSGFGWLAILLTSFFFGIVHLGNPNASAISTVNTVLAGIWFAVAYLKTRDLWFVWGMHLIWNWTQGSIFGIEVSGITSISTAPLLKEIDKGPAWLTGENYGIEGGIACTAALIISTLTIYFIPAIRPSEEMLALTTPRPPRELASTKLSQIS